MDYRGSAARMIEKIAILDGRILWYGSFLGGHPKPAIDGHLKTGQRRKHSGH
jgi:hypothetical protein